MSAFDFFRLPTVAITLDDTSVAFTHSTALKTHRHPSIRRSSGTSRAFLIATMLDRRRLEYPVSVVEITGGEIPLWSARCLGFIFFSRRITFRLFPNRTAIGHLPFRFDVTLIKKGFSFFFIPHQTLSLIVV